MISDTSQNNPKPLRISNIVINEESQSKTGNDTKSILSSIQSVQLSRTKDKSGLSDIEYINDGNINENVIKKIKKIKILFFEMIFIYIVYFILLFSSSLVGRHNNLMEIQDSHSKLWFYKCINESNSIIYNAIEIVILFIILLKGNSLLSFNGIFKSSIYTTYSAWVGLIFGPIINVTMNLYKFLLCIRKKLFNIFNGLYVCINIYIYHLDYCHYIV
ncbi:hypothetical protein BCR36DRAFT_26858 [Piromyces finnis]|uniref:Uncharacterized protein n=1 Tax=Piromyces finnis TaxID=1754191 RepID=A0A1Y1UJ39_9FUNG|nr:hypothetical protein BCR36DRAFT_26858 [Piromyces finnis]|eukprot:ORX37496.1 hypothetical protein BCR36DRAFT_26858 [Piromyces finnis]